MSTLLHQEKSSTKKTGRSFLHFYHSPCLSVIAKKTLQLINLFAVFSRLKKSIYQFTLWSTWRTRKGGGEIKINTEIFVSIVTDLIIIYNFWHVRISFQVYSITFLRVKSPYSSFNNTVNGNHLLTRWETELITSTSRSLIKEQLHWQ